MIVYNSIIPFKGFLAINLFTIIFVRKELKDNFKEQNLNHEKIHTAQMKELLFIFCYLWYGIEWSIRLIIYWSPSKAYRNMWFEREAYNNQDNLEYLNNRKFFAFLRS